MGCHGPNVYYAYPMDPQHAERFLETVRNVQANPGDAGDNQTALLDAYTAVVKGNFDQFTELLADDAELHISGFRPMNGSWRGRGDVVAASKKNFALISDQRSTVESMISQGDSIAVLISETGVIDGRSYDLRGVQWFTFEQGKLKRIEQILVEASAR